MSMNTSMKIKSNVKAAGYSSNHSRTVCSGLKVKSAIKAAGISPNHNRTLLSA